MSTEAAHRLTIVDRNTRDNARHRHRWEGKCSCGGWASTPMRSKRTVEQHYHRHVERVANPPPGVRRELTPRDELPEALR